MTANNRKVSRFSRIVIGLFLVTVLLATGCGSQPATADPALVQAQVELAIQQTSVAATITALAQAPTEPPPPPPVEQPTQPPPPTPVPPVAQATDPAPQGESSIADFETWMRSANILVYEDIIFHPKLSRHVKDTLSEMGVHFTYVGSAIGNFKKKLLYEAPPGGWDLIIVANEAKEPWGMVRGEYFDYLEDALLLGTPVILEMFYLDDVAQGEIRDILELCGIEYEADWGYVSERDMILWPLDMGHPILNVPNDNLSFTKVTSVWAHNYDIGDQVRIGPGGDARLLLGRSSGRPDVHGALTTCLNNHLILQTFGTHQFGYETMRGLWENYVYNALKARYTDLYP